MPPATLNQVVQLASRLPGDEKELLIEVLQHQRADEWRKELARYARKAEKDFHSGKLQAESAESLVERLRSTWAGDEPQ